MKQEYSDRNYVKDVSNVETCYLCGLALNGNMKSDHIIPNKLFSSGSPDKPQLPVHHACNNGKSKEDEWFIRQINLLSGLNEDAAENTEKLLRKAELQRPSGRIEGKAYEIRDYKIAVSLLNGHNWGEKQVQENGETLYLLNLNKHNGVRTSAYIKQMCRGLYVKNVPGSNPTTKPKLTGMQYAHASHEGRYKQFENSVKNLIQNTSSSGFFQRWSDCVFYYGSHVVESSDKGFVFIEFYGEVGYLAMFGNGESE